MASGGLRSGSSSPAVLASAWCIAFIAGAAAPARWPAGGVQPGPAVSLPDYDVRRDDPRMRARLARAPAQRTAAAGHAAAARLVATIPQFRVDRHPVFGTPSYVGSTARLLTEPMGPAAVDAVAIVTEFVARHSELFGVNATELAASRLSRDFVTGHNKVGHLSFQQRLAGIDVFGAVLRAGVTRHGEIISLGSTLLGCPPGGFNAPAAVLPIDEAIRLAAADIGLELGSTPGSPNPPGLSGPIEVRRVWFPLTPADLRPAWEAVLPESGVGNVYQIIIDAIDGTVLRRWNRLQRVADDDTAYLVYVPDSPAPGSPGRDAPDGVQFPFVSAGLVAVAAADIAPFSPAGWIDQGLMETLGNNVDAHTDLDHDDQPDLPRPAGDADGVFAFPADPQFQYPADYSDAAVVQVFYLCNVFHDRLYELGFDEAAHNFQQDNFDGGGLGGDRILADAQDGGGFNEATFATGPEDGTAARLQMRVFSGPSPSRDSSLDCELVFHELSHGVSIRLLGGLEDVQPRGLGEGWSDFLAMALNAEAGDDPHGTYPFGAYVAYERWPGYVDNYYFGLRRFPYCTDFNRNPQTYADIDPAQESYPPGIPRNANVPGPADEPHNAGEIWCMALMQCRANLIDRHGFAGNQLMMQLVIDGMKLAVSNPTYVQARDAILQADLVNNGGANLDELWEAFAARGLGASAVSPSTGSGGIVESYEIPDMVVFSYPQGRPTTIPPGAGATITVRLHGLGEVSPVPDTGRLHYSIDGDPFTSVDLVAVGSDTYEASLPGAACLSTYAYYFSVEQAPSGETATDPPAAPATTFHALAAAGSQVIFAHDFEADSGWTAGAAGDDATAGVWNRMDPEGTSVGGEAVQPEDDHTASPGAVCWVTDGLAGGSVGARDVDGGRTTLTSPLFSLAGQDAAVSYWRWYSNDAGLNPNQDVLEVSVSNDDGATWQLAETVGPDGPQASGGWFHHEFLLSDYVPPAEQMRVRFVAADDGDPSLVEAAVDDFQVTVYFCSAGDFDGDGDVDLDDFAVFADCAAGPDVTEAPPGCDPADLAKADLDGDGDVDLEDFGGFQGAFTGLR